MILTLCYEFKIHSFLDSFSNDLLSIQFALGQ